MSIETRNDYTLKGNPQTVRGAKLTVGDDAPDFKLDANDWSQKSLADYDGKIKLINIVPSLDTGICDAQTKRFNEVATDLGDDVVVLTVSADLPFAQKRWCGTIDAVNLETLSAHRDASDFGEDYGVFHEDWGVLQRSIILIDKDNKVAYTQYVPELASHPEYDEAIEAAKKLAE